MSGNDLFERIRFRGSPVADPESQVKAGDARFTLLTPRLVRMEWSPAERFDDRATFAFPARRAPVPAFRVAQGEGLLHIDTGAVRLSYRPDGGRFAADNLSAAWASVPPLDCPGRRVPRGAALAAYACWEEWTPGSADPGNLRGTLRTLDGCEGDAALEEGLLSRSGWALFDDSLSIRFSPGDGWVEPPAVPPYLDWYLFAYGHDYAAALADYCHFGGQVPLIPRFVLGAWWSRYWAYSDRDLKKLVREFERRRFPLDVLVVDMDWHTPHAWTGYTWNRDLFPDPPAFLHWVHDKGLHVTLNLHPAQGVQPFEEVYARFAQSLGMDPAGQKPVAFHISERAFVKSYFELLHHPLEEQGVDFWWVDWQQGASSEMKGLDPLPWLNHLHFSDSRRRGARPLLYSRWGGLGSHRYPVGFSGDTYVGWSALQFQPYLTSTGSNVGCGWWGHDIGGHMGGATEPELFARWVQFGALSPVMRLHATKDPRAERRPWAYPRPVSRAAREAFRLRYQLIPYLYTMARVAADTGISLCRPMYYEHPEDESAYAARYQYYLGDQLIAAPIVHPANPLTCMASTDVWIPPGAWTDFFTKEVFEGPGWVRIVGSLDRIPLLVRSGGILPLAGDCPPAPSPRLSSGTTDAIQSGRLTLAIFPGEYGTFRLYEDDGTTEAYRHGQFEWTPVTSRMASPGLWQVHIGATEGHCTGLPRERSVEIRLVGSRRPESVTLDGLPHTNWVYDPTSLVTTIPLSKRDRRVPLVVAAFSPGGMVALGADHNRRLIRKDVARLLGRRRPFSDRVGDAEVLRTVLQSQGPGRADAVARLGGPFLRVIEHNGIDQARHSLGQVIAAAPRIADRTFDLVTQFDMQPHSSPDSRPGGWETRIHATSDTHILDAPPAPLDPIHPARWTADIAISWQGALLACHHSSRPLFPAIPAWQVAVVDEALDPTWDRVLHPDGSPFQDLGWATFAQSPEGLVNVHQPHILYLSRDYATDPQVRRRLVGYLAATFVSPVEHDAIFEFRSPGPAEVRLNGRPIAVKEGEYEGTIHPALRPARRTEAMRLQAGENCLAIRSRPEQNAGTRWVFGGSLTSLAGEVLVDLDYRLACGR